MLLVSRFLVVPLAGDGRSAIDPFAGMCIDQQQVLVRVGLLFAAGGLLLLGRIARALAAALGAVTGHIRGACQRQGAGGNPARVTLRRQAESGSGPWQDGQQVMHPVVGLGWAQLEW